MLPKQISIPKTDEYNTITHWISMVQKIFIRLGWFVLLLLLQVLLFGHIHLFGYARSEERR